MTPKMNKSGKRKGGPAIEQQALIPEAAPVPAPTRGGPPWKSKTRNGYMLDVVISALQKAVRRGREREALFWGDELYMKVDGFPYYGGYFWRRMMIIAHEDVGGFEIPQFIAAAHYNAMVASSEGGGRVEGLIEAHAVLVLCRAEKTREACDAAMAVMVAKKEGWRIEPHPSALDKHTGIGKRMGKDMADFGRVGRVVAGELGPNDYELTHWGFRQPFVARPGEKGGEPDVVIPPHQDYHLRGGGREPGEEG